MTKSFQSQAVRLEWGGLGRSGGGEGRREKVRARDFLYHTRSPQIPPLQLSSTVRFSLTIGTLIEN